MKEVKSYTIKEVAELSGLPESTLRYYETIGIINPVGRDPSSKHRAYYEDDINVVIAVSCLNATGMSIEDMKSYLKNRVNGKSSASSQIELLETQKHHLAQEAENLKLRRKYVDIKISYWQAFASGNKAQIEKMTRSSHEITKEMQQINK